MATLWIFGHQLSLGLTGLTELDQKRDVILMVEAKSRSVWQRYHKQKLVLLFSAMRHFAEELREQGYTVDYRTADSFEAGWKEHIHEHEPREIILHMPTDYRMRALLSKWTAQQEQQGRKVTVHEESALFVVREAEWKELLPDGRSWKLDSVYRQLRKRWSVLLEDGKPIGGKWSYDAENRKRPKAGLTFPPHLSFPPDDITEGVIKEVEEAFPNHFGEADSFAWPVTRADALAAFEHFVAHRLPTFGDYQDAMMTDSPFMSHSLISGAINIGLLDPLMVIRRVEQAYTDGAVPLAAAEGFIRQVLGWREYVRGVYLQAMPDYRNVNDLHHDRALPKFYWDAETNMNCLRQCVRTVMETGYSHHIQRLMVLGNFANLAGIRPQEVADWFNEVYVDAYDWVVLPNVLGMALYADGGLMSTKPYISSGQYINKMSDYCKNCRYDVKQKLGADACPFNALYWGFIARHEERLSSNPRMGIMYKNWSNQSEKERDTVLQQCRTLLERLEEGAL